MGYYSLIQQIGFLAALPGFLLIIATKNLISVAPGGTVFAGDLFFRTLFSAIPAIVGWAILLGNGFNKALNPTAEGVILGSQAVAMLISIILVFLLPIRSISEVGTKIHRGRFLVPMSLLWLITTFLAVRHFFILPKEKAAFRENDFAPVDNFPCETKPDSKQCDCSKKPDSSECLCFIDSESQKCKDAIAKESAEAEQTENGTEGFTTVEDISGPFEPRIQTLKKENAEIFIKDPAAITDPRLNIEFYNPFTPDSIHEDWFDFAVQTNRQRKLIFGS